MKNKGMEAFLQELDQMIEDRSMSENEKNPRYQGKEKLDRENKGLLRLGEDLATMDFNGESSKERLYRTLSNGLQEDERMKKKFSFKKYQMAAAIIAAVMVVTVTTAQTGFAKNVIDGLARAIHLGKINVVQVENTKPADGVMKEAAAEEEKCEMLVLKDLKSIRETAGFQVKVPTWLPAGYELDRGEFYLEDNGAPSKDYVDLYFVNKKTGKLLYLQERDATKDIGFTLATDKLVEEVKVGDIKGALTGGNSLNWEVDQVLLGLSTKGSITKDELLKMAESMK